MNLTVDERVELDRRVALAMQRLDENDNVRDTLIDIYCENLPDKDRWQGEMMADRLIAAVFSAKEQCADANDPRSDYIARRLENVVAGMDNEAACKALFVLVEALKTLKSGDMTAYFSSSEPGKALEALQKAVEEREYTGPYDLASRNSLIREARRLLSGSTMTGTVIDNISGESAGRQDAPRLLLEGRIQEDTLAALNAMILYTMANDGSIGSVSYPLTVEEAALAVCSREYIERAIRDYKIGIITIRQCEKLVAVMETVAILSLWALEAAGILFYMGLAAKNAGLLTAVLTAFLLAKAFSELNVLMVEDMEKALSNLSTNLYRKALIKQIRREAPVAAETVDTSAREAELPSGTTIRKPSVKVLKPLDVQLDEDVDIQF